MMAVGSKDGLITVYDEGTGQNVTVLRGHKASICKLALVSHSGKKYLASGSDHGCSSIILWDLSTWNIRMKIEYHKAAVTAIVDLQTKLNDTIVGRNSVLELRYVKSRRYKIIFWYPLCNEGCCHFCVQCSVYISKFLMGQKCTKTI